MSAGDIQARIGLDPSEYGRGAEAVIQFNRRIEDNQRQVDRAIEDLSRRRARLEEQLARQVAAGKIEQSERTRRAIEDDERRMTRVITDGARRARRAHEDLSRQVGDQGTAAFGRLGSAAKSAIASIVSIGTALTAMRSILDAAREIRQEWRDAAAEAVRFREEVRTTGGVLGLFGQEITEEVLQFQAATGFATAGQASQFIQSFGSAIEIPADRGLISDAQRQRLRLRGGQLAAALGLPAEDFAETLGLIAERTQGQITADATLAQAEQVRAVLQQGVGDLALLPQVRQFAGAAVDERGNLLASVPEAAALVSLASLAGSGDAGKRAEILFRSVVEGLVKETKVRGAERTQAEFLTEVAGIRSEDDPLTRVRKLFETLQREVPEGVPVVEFLARQGFGRSQERLAIQALLSRAQEGDLDRIFGALEGGQAAAAARVDQTIRRNLGDVGAIANQARALQAIQEQRVGEEALPLDTFMRQIEAARPALRESTAARGLRGFLATVTGGLAGTTAQQREALKERLALQIAREAIVARGLEGEVAAELGVAPGQFDIIAEPAPRRGVARRIEGRRALVNRYALPEGVGAHQEFSAMARVLQREAGINPLQEFGRILMGEARIQGAGLEGPVREQVEQAQRMNDTLNQVRDQLVGLRKDVQAQNPNRAGLGRPAPPPAGGVNR